MHPTRLSCQLLLFCAPLSQPHTLTPHLHKPLPAVLPAAAHIRANQQRELGIQLRRDVKPGLDEAGVKLFLVSIGTWERSGQFADVTGFPRDCLLADPGSVTYEALGLVKGLQQTFLAKEVSN